MLVVRFMDDVIEKHAMQSSATVFELRVTAAIGNIHFTILLMPGSDVDLDASECAGPVPPALWQGSVRKNLRRETP
jgi:hypothetical protein